MLDKMFLGMLVLVPVTVAASFLRLPAGLLFFLAALAIVPLAKFIGEATEVLAARVGSGLGGLINATFGNATELIIGILALQAGLIEVVKASITGSIIGNLLLVSGSSIFIGGFKYEKQKFNKTAAMTASSTLLLAMIALVIPAIFIKRRPTPDKS